jgi:hypothetical protein
MLLLKRACDARFQRVYGPPSYLLGRSALPPGGPSTGLRRLADSGIIGIPPGLAGKNRLALLGQADEASAPHELRFDAAQGGGG